jgi:hypothetical protein
MGRIEIIYLQPHAASHSYQADIRPQGRSRFDSRRNPVRDSGVYPAFRFTSDDQDLRPGRLARCSEFRHYNAMHFVDRD